MVLVVHGQNWMLLAVFNMSDVLFNDVVPHT